MNPPRKLHIKSYGCQMNVYDAQRMVDTLAPEGFVETASVDDADLVILNTCHIREKASEKVYSELGRLRAGGRRRGRSAKLSPSAATAGAGQAPRPRAGDRISDRRQIRIFSPAEAGSDPGARHFLVRHRAGRLRQVLHLLRGAVYAR